MSDTIDKSTKTAELDDEDLSTIAAIACNYQSGRITKYEVGELIRGYRERSALLKVEEALRELIHSSSADEYSKAVIAGSSALDELEEVRSHGK